MKISLAMIVKNEELNIEKCLNSVVGLVDEIVIVDTGSTDNTIEKIKQFPDVKLFYFDWCDDFSIARNYSIEKTSGDYVLVLDADEYIHAGNRAELEKVIQLNAVGKILIDSHFRKNNQDYRSTTYVSRFFPKDTRFVGAIHEQLDTQKKRIATNLVVKHNGYYHTDKSKRNIPYLIKEVKKNPNDPYYLFQLGKELRISERYKESYHFLEKSYVLVNKNAPYYGQLIIELIYSGKEYGEDKLFKLISDNEGILKNLTDFHFAKGLFYMDYCLSNPIQTENYMRNIESSFLKCISLDENTKIEYLIGTGSYLPAFNLGVYYEVIGNIEKAIYFYEQSSQWGYSLARDRIKILNEQNK